MDKTQFLHNLRAGRAAWDALVDRARDDWKTRPGVQGGWSFKDVIAHMTWFEREMVTMLRAHSLEGSSDLWLRPTDERNAAIYELNKDRPLAEVMAETRQVYEQLVEVVETLDEADLHHTTRYEGMPSDWVPWEVIASNCYDHYLQHTPDVEAWLDGMEKSA